jgi:pseudouridine-5'-phosphate glycosidase
MIEPQYKRTVRQQAAMFLKLSELATAVADSKTPAETVAALMAYAEEADRTFRRLEAAGAEFMRTRMGILGGGIN